MPSIVPRARRLLSFSGQVGSNLKVKALSEVGVKGGRLLLVVAAARIWGPERFGVYAFAAAFAGIVMTAADFGLQLHLARSIAQGGGRAALASAVRAKAWLSLATTAALAVACLLYPRPEVRAVLLAAGGMLLAQSWCEFWNHYFRGRQRLRDEALLNLVYVLGGSAVGCLALLRGADVLTLYLVLLGAALVGNGVGIARVGALLRGSPAPPTPDAATPARLSAWTALKGAFPIGLAILLSTIFFRIDMVLLERIRGDAATGAYGAAYRLLESTLFLPALLLAALFPAFAEASRAPKEDLARLLHAGLRWMFLLGTGLAAAIVVAAPLGLRILYGEAYAESVVLLRLLAPTLCFIFPNYVLTHFLVATGEQKRNTWIMALGIPVNISMNLAVIPEYGARGAAVATMVTEVILLAATWIAAERRLARQPVGFTPHGSSRAETG